MLDVHDTILTFDALHFNKERLPKIAKTGGEGNIVSWPKNHLAGTPNILVFVLEKFG